MKTLEDRTFYAVLGVGIIASLVSGVLTFIEGLGWVSLFTALACTAAMIGLWVASSRYHQERICRVILVYLVNFVLFPLNYFVCGALNSGMILFYLLGLFVVAILLRGAQRVVAYILSLLALEASITIGRYYPKIVTPMTPWQQYQDVKITLFLTGTTLVVMATLILRAYEAERKHNEVLMERQRRLSLRDPMCGLYNRRELFRRLETIFQDPEISDAARKDTYIAMFDVDDFKRINDTYGHHFGDKALITAARVMQNGCRPEDGELAARYGGEEFVCLLSAPDRETAFARVDAMRKKLGEIQWEEAPGLRITMSGGLVACRDYQLLNRATSDVDKLLYQAKARGKNQICDAFDGPADPCTIVDCK